MAMRRCPACAGPLEIDESEGWHCKPCDRTYVGFRNQVTGEMSNFNPLNRRKLSKRELDMIMQGVEEDEQ